MNSRFRLVEVYGSLLLPSEIEEKILKENGIMKEVGKEERKGWKLSFDRYSEEKKKKPAHAVLNLVYTGNPEDVYYTTIYEVDGNAYVEIMKREMGNQTAKQYKHGRLSDANSYRPIQLESKFGITDIFIIPFLGRQRAQTHWNDDYVKKVRDGIEKSYKDMPMEKNVNLEALKRAVEESKNI